MIPKHAVYGCALGLAAVVQGQMSVDGMKAAFAGLPSCNAPCVDSLMTTASCVKANSTFATCLCSNDTGKEDFLQCVAQVCDAADDIHKTINFSKTSCGEPIRDIGRFIFIEEFTLLAISSLAIILRIIFKALDKSSSMSSIGMDDGCILVAYAILVPKTYLCGVLIVNTGLGRDVWTLSIDKVMINAYYWYIATILYFAVIHLIKASLLFVFMRIFTCRDGDVRLWGRWDLRRVLMLTMAATLASALAFVVASVFQCRPISYYWTRVDGLHRGKCFKIGDFVWANAAIGIAIDFWMLYLPLSQIQSLSLSRWKKIGVVCMFLVGFLVTIVSIIRLNSLISFSPDNPTWDAVRIMVWSSLELHTGVICACLPALRVGLGRTLPAAARRLAGRSSDQQLPRGGGTRLSDGRAPTKGKFWSVGSWSEDGGRGGRPGGGNGRNPSYSCSVQSGVSAATAAGFGGVETYKMSHVVVNKPIESSLGA